MLSTDRWSRRTYERYPRECDTVAGDVDMEVYGFSCFNWARTCLPRLPVEAEVEAPLSTETM